MDSDLNSSQRSSTARASPFDEMGRITGLIQKYQAKVDVIDIKIVELERHLEALKEERKVHTSHIKSYHNAIVHIHRLPEDILSSIFLALLPTGSESPSPHSSVIISHVCRQWRRISVSLPLLWTDINIASPKGAPSNKRLRRRWLRCGKATKKRVLAFLSRSCSCPLVVTIDMSDPECQYATSDMYFPFTEAVDACCVREWKNAVVLLRPNPSMPCSLGFLSVFALYKPDSIRNVVLNIKYLHEGELQGTIWQGLENRIDFRRTTVHSLTARMGWADMRCIDAQWEALTELSVGGVTHPRGSLSPENALHILSKVPNLERCYIELCEAMTESPISVITPVFLPKLRSLTICGVAPPQDFSNTLHLPSLTHLRVVHEIPRKSPLPQDESTSALVFLIRQYGGQLTDVSFDFAFLTPSALLFCLERLVNVETLDLTTSKPTSISETAEGSRAMISSEIIKAFSASCGCSSEDGKEGWLCRKMKTLRLRMREASHETIMELQGLIDARRGSETERGCVTRLEHLVVDFDSGCTARLERSGAWTKELDMNVLVLLPYQASQ